MDVAGVLSLRGDSEKVARGQDNENEGLHQDTSTSLSAGTAGKLFVTSGLGGMSGAQPKAGNIAGVVSVTAEINPEATYKRHEQGWVDEVIKDLDELCSRVQTAKDNKEVVSIAYDGNIVDVWEKFDKENIFKIFLIIH